MNDRQLGEELAREIGRSQDKLRLPPTRLVPIGDRTKVACPYIVECVWHGRLDGEYPNHKAARERAHKHNEWHRQDTTYYHREVDLQDDHVYRIRGQATTLVASWTQDEHGRGWGFYDTNPPQPPAEEPPYDPLIFVGFDGGTDYIAPWEDSRPEELVQVWSPWKLAHPQGGPTIFTEEDLLEVKD